MSGPASRPAPARYFFLTCTRFGYGIGTSVELPPSL